MAVIRGRETVNVLDVEFEAVGVAAALSGRTNAIRSMFVAAGVPGVPAVMAMRSLVKERRGPALYLPTATGQPTRTSGRS